MFCKFIWCKRNHFEYKGYNYIFFLLVSGFEEKKRQHQNIGFVILSTAKGKIGNRKETIMTLSIILIWNKTKKIEQSVLIMYT
jgi:hypothetical protein